MGVLDRLDELEAISDPRELRRVLVARALAESFRRSLRGEPDELVRALSKLTATPGAILRRMVVVRRLLELDGVEDQELD